MKKRFLTGLILLIASLSYAQEARFGFTVSPSFGFTNVESSGTNAAEGTSYTDNTEGKTGIIYGAMLDYDFTSEDRYYLHTGLMMHHTGFNLEHITATGANEVTETSEVNVNYLELPLILKLKTDDIGYLRYFGQFGLNNAIKVGEKLQDGPQGGSLTEASNFNIGLNMGGGIEYAVSPQTSAVGGVYYVNGFSKVFDNSAGSVKQNQLAIRLGVYF